MVPLGDTLEDLDADGVVLETLRRDQGGPERLIEVLAAAFVHRLPVTWTGLLPGRHVDLPTYAFQHGRYWLDEPARSVEPDGLGLAAAGHPLLGAVVESAQDGRVMFTGRLSQSSHPWLAGHAVLGTVIVPGTALLEMAAWAGGEVCRPDIEELTLHAPLVLPDATAVRGFNSAARSSGLVRGGCSCRGNFRAAAGGCHHACWMMERRDGDAAVRSWVAAPSRLTAIRRFRRSGGRISHVAPAAAPLLACGMPARGGLWCVSLDW